MNIWLVTIGEPVPDSVDFRGRLHRTGQFALSFSKDAGIEWWTSAFDHFSRKFMAEDGASIQIGSGLRISVFRGCGYSSNVSVRRLLDQRILAKKMYAAFSRASKLPDIILCSVPPVGIAGVAVSFAGEAGVPVVLDLRDMWPDIFVDHAPSGLKSAAKLLLRPMFREAEKVFSRADALIGITDEFLEWGLGKAGRERNNWDTVIPFAYNSVPPAGDTVDVAARAWDKLGIGEKHPFRVCFLGSLSRQFDIPTVIKASEMLRARKIAVQFVICGDGDCLRKFRKMAEGNPDVIFPGWVDAAAIYTLMRRSSAGIAPLPDRYDYLATINNKSVEYLSASLPIISCPSKGALARFLSERKCGVSFDYGRPELLAELIEGLTRSPGRLAQMSHNAKNAFEDNFVAEKVNSALLAHLERIVAEYKSAKN
ncbi:MAG: glycosyltransferase family 4 protein [Elusimicrobiales bacterium]|nr:glycosyltransferase family 4 protein [Elusimicrobiales bacterium]